LLDRIGAKSEPEISYVATAHTRSPASAMSSGIDFSLSGTAHLLAGFRLSLPRAAYSSRWIDTLQSMIVRIAKYFI
jgi:hypothetical protein